MRRSWEAHGARLAQQDIARTGLGWLYFMGLNGSVRYNLLRAAEDILHARRGHLPPPCMHQLATAIASYLQHGGSRSTRVARVYLGNMRRLRLRQVSFAMVPAALGGAAAVQHGCRRTRMDLLRGGPRSGEDRTLPEARCEGRVKHLGLKWQLAFLPERQPLLKGERSQADLPSHLTDVKESSQKTRSVSGLLNQGVSSSSQRHDGRKWALCRERATIHTSCWKNVLFAGRQAARHRRRLLDHCAWYCFSSLLQPG
jgi:hypothetical protein